MKFKSILITGGSGYLAKNLTRHLLSKNLCDRICVYSRGELAQAEMRTQFKDDPRLRWFIGCVRDYRRLERAMNCVDLVIHAAALKRVEVGVMNPLEMKMTNIDGTSNVIEAAHDAGVEKVVFVSSDKAHSPVSVYGFSKAFGEALILAANNTSGDATKYSVCRYGNVFNSAGSVVPRWKALIAAGAKEVPVTDPDCTRFMMRVDDAVKLVLETAVTMKGGELAIPDLPAYRLGDLAEAMGVKPKITGLPSWEKLAESMSADKSSDKAPRLTVDDLRKELATLPALRLAA